MKAMKQNSDELSAKDEEIHHLQQQLEDAEGRHLTELQEKNEQFQQNNVEISRLQDVLRLKDAQLASTSQRLTTQLREKEERLREKDVRLREKDVRLREGEERERELLAQLQLKEAELEQRNADITRLHVQRQVQRNTDIGEHSGKVDPTPLTKLKLPLKLNWRSGNCKDLPFGTWFWPQVAVVNNKVYIGGGDASSDKEKQTVIVYDPQHDSYDTLPPYTYKYFSMAVVNNQLVLVGGRDVRTDKVTNQLSVWNGQWTHPLPPMITARSAASVITHNNRWLVVMGGHGGDCGTLSCVEILDTSESRQWYRATPLPHPCYRVLPVTFGNMCYLLGGITTGGAPSKKVFSVFLDSLITQAVSQPTGASAPPTSSPWQALTDTLLVYSTALSFNGALLAVGGGRGSRDIYHYQPSSKRWIKAGELPTGRRTCTCTVLPSGEVFVAGSGGTTTRVDIALIL